MLVEEVDEEHVLVLNVEVADDVLGVVDVEQIVVVLLAC